ncbi:TonB-dependent receptor plug domain-containing protein [Algibacillus agarilyticus]|uniref:TonB-dependent receptor plug domain-containing protein n=1 Tax=Algibacillus agarilyticus TaxID=2234133 RepID=UPI000DD0A817|nr:TonB-dependent receptor [Algibacillus agarilyticus]
MKLNILSVALLSALALQISASEYIDSQDDYFDDFYGGEELIEIATGTKKQFHLLPSVATVITANDIAKMGALNIDEVLQRVPGLNVAPSTAARLTPVYSVRGVQTGFNPQILVLLDGVEFKHPTSSSLTYGFRYPVNNIERIEVIRGPGSAVYGADAFSGVINIITKKTSNNSSRIGFTAGSFGTTEAWGNIQGSMGDVDIGLSFSQFETDGDDERIIEHDLQTNLDNTFSTSASLAPTKMPTQAKITNIHLNLNYADWSLENWYWNLSDGGAGNGATQTIDNIGSDEAYIARTKLSYDAQITEDWNISADASYYQTETDSYLVLFPKGAKVAIGDDGNLFTPNDPNVVGGGVAHFPDGVVGNPIPKLTEYRTNFVSKYDGYKNHHIRIGVGLLHSELVAREHKNFGPGILDGEKFKAEVSGLLTDVTGTPNIYVGDKSRDSYYLSLQDEWRLANDWEVTFGLRYDDYSDIGSTFNPRGAIVWQAHHNLTLKLLHGSAFRAPSFSELFITNNPSALGNPDIEPEKISTSELVIDYRPTTDSMIAINFYQYSAKDLIIKVQDPEPATSTTSQNASSQDGYGFEVEGRYQFSDDVSWNGSFSYQHSEDGITGLEVANSPSILLYNALSYDVNSELTLATQINSVMDQQRAITDSRENIKNFTLVNLTALYKINTNLQIKASVKNLFDEQYVVATDGRIPNDIPMEGRSLYGFVEFAF